MRNRPDHHNARQVTRGYLLNAENEELERIPIDKMTREELNQLMVEKGIEKKEAKEEGSQHDEI